jgi:DNA-binding CsgD family transcriptional regulator
MERPCLPCAWAPGTPDAERLHRALGAIPGLTGQELSVFRCLATGPTNAQLAAHLHLTVRTAKFHVANIRAKLGGVSRLQACLLAVHHALAGGPDGGAAAGSAPAPRTSACGTAAGHR